MDFWYSCGKCWYLHVFFWGGFLFVCFFFLFFLNFHLLGCRASGWVKGLKIAQNEKLQLHLTLAAIFQEQCNIWSWFLVHLCKTISHCFEVFIFCAVRRVKGKSIARLLLDKRLKFCPQLFFAKYWVSVCLNNYLHEVLSRWRPKRNFLNFRSPYCWKIYFQHSLWLQKHTLHIVCLQRQHLFLEL